MKISVSKLVGLCLMLMSLNAFAAPHHDHGSHGPVVKVLDEFNFPMVVERYNPRRLFLSDNYFVKKITFSAYAQNYSSTIQVRSNGTVLRTFHLNQYQSRYTVYVDRRMRNLEFVNITGLDYRAAQVSNVTVFGFFNHSHNPGHFHPNPGGVTHSHSYAVKISQRAIRVIDILDENTKWEDYGYYLLPIKKVAARTLAISLAEGDSSAKTIAQLKKLSAQIDFAQDYIDEVLSVDNLFNSYVELVNIRNEIEEMLD